ncbi:MAG: serine/threonine-protein kinase [Gemmatimonadales bacterium]
MANGSGSLLERLRLAVAPDFTVERELASGGMGTVFLGHDVKLDRPVAIKILRPDLATATGAERFLREARALASLSHPKIVPIFRVDERGGLLYYVMEYIRGETLAARLTRGPLPLSEVLRLGDDLLHALETAHRVLIHRDIKPSNIFLRDGDAILADFGIARPSGDSPSGLTEQGSPLGTPGYMAVEQAAGDAVTPQTDLYAVGLVLYEASSGSRLPPLTPVDQVDWSGVPRPLRAVIRHALQWEPARRWSDATTFRNALARVREWRSRTTPLRVAAIVVMLPLVVATAQALWRQLYPTQPTCPPRADLALPPFEVSGGVTSLDGEDFARLVGARLDWYGRLVLAPIECRVTRAEATSSNAAGATRAAYVAEGRLVPRGPITVLSLTLYHGAERFGTIDVPGDAARIFDWSRETADSLVARLFPTHWDEYHELVAGSTPRTSLQAWRHYFAGEREFQRDAYRFAKSQYDSALALDSSFVQAAWRLGVVKRFLREPFEDDLKQLLVRHPDLPVRYRNLIEALLESDLNRRFVLYQRTVSSFPRDGYARFVYADELFHRGPLVGIPLDVALVQFDSTVKVDPWLDQMPAYDHLLYGYLRLGWRAQADATLGLRVRIRPSGEAEDARRRKLLKLAYDFRFNPPLARVKVWALTFTADSALLEGVNRYLRLAPSFDIPGALDPMGHLLVRNSTLPYVQANGYMGIGLGDMMLGRPMAALPRLDSAAALYSTLVPAGHSVPPSFRPVDSLLEQAVWRVMPGVLGLPGINETEVTWGLRTLETLLQRSGSAPRAAFALAAAAYQHADTTAALHYSGIVRNLAASDSGIARLSLLLTAMQVAARGLPDSAITLSQPLLNYTPRGELVDPFSRSVRYLREAEWLRAAHRDEAADRMLLWYQNSETGIEGWPQWQLAAGDVDNMLGVYARLLQAEAALVHGDTATACPLLSRVLELWEDAEPGTAPLKQRAVNAAKGCPR